MRFMTATAAVVAAMSLTIHATVTVPTDFRQVVSDATTIVQGHVTDVRALTDPVSHRVETVATVAVDATLKGDTVAFVSVRVPGGVVGNLKVVAVGAPHFAVGDVAIFFLKAGSDGVMRPIGLTMGVYPVAQDPTTHQTAVSPPVALGINTASGTVVRGDPARQLMTVSEFSSLVKLVMASQARATPRGGGR